MQTAERQDERDPPTAEKPRRVVNLPLRLTPAQHDALRKIAYEQRVSLHSLVLEGVAAVLQKHGR